MFDIRDIRVVVWLDCDEVKSLCWGRKITWYQLVSVVNN